MSYEPSPFYVGFAKMMAGFLQQSTDNDIIRHYRRIAGLACGPNVTDKDIGQAAAVLLQEAVDNNDDRENDIGCASQCEFILGAALLVLMTDGERRRKEIEKNV